MPIQADQMYKVLNNLNFEVQQGQNIALVGPSGAGKTTLASILFGFYKIKEGQITIDGPKEY